MLTSHDRPVFSSRDDTHLHLQQLPTNYHSQSFSQFSSRTPAVFSSQWNCGLPHRRCPSCLPTTTTTTTTTIIVVVRRANQQQHALPRHPPTLRHLARKTHPGDAGRSRPKTAHADRVPPAYPRSRRHDTRRQGARRGAERPRQRGTNGRAAENGTQGPAWFCRRRVETRVWRETIGRLPFGLRRGGPQTANNWSTHFGWGTNARQDRGT